MWTHATDKDNAKKSFIRRLAETLKIHIGVVKTYFDGSLANYEIEVR